MNIFRRLRSMFNPFYAALRSSAMVIAVRIADLLSPSLRWKIAQQGEQAWWNEWLSSHTDDNAWLTTLLAYFGLRDGQSFPGETLVDIGGGPIGILTKFSAKEKIVIDPLPLDSNDPSIRRIKAPGEHIPLPDACADKVFLYNVLQHVASPAAVLNEAARILVPGGVCSIAEQLHLPTDRLHPHSLDRSLFDQWVKTHALTVLRSSEKPDWTLTRHVPGSGYAALILIVKKDGPHER